jgi:hypothetical protein
MFMCYCQARLIGGTPGLSVKMRLPLSRCLCTQRVSPITRALTAAYPSVTLVCTAVRC